MCDCFHLAFPNWHAASSGTGAGRRLRGPEPGAEDNSICDEPSRFAEGERPRPQGSSPVEEYPETEKYSDSDKECEADHDPHHKTGGGKKSKKSGLGSMFEKRSTPKMSKLKEEADSSESGVIVKTAKDGCAEGLVYGGGGKDGIFIKEVIPESPASKSLNLKEGDKILSATVYFDNMSYEDAIQILEHAQAYKVKLCLKRKPDIKETDPIIKSDVIPEKELHTPEMREQGKTKRRSDDRISWPKFPSFGKGRKSHFRRSHSSSEADEQRKLELSPTTSDTESPIKSQDALKGKKRHKIKLSTLTRRGRISSSEDQDTDTPTTGQISGKILQTHETSDMLSLECLESPSGETPGVYATQDLKVLEDSCLEQNYQKMAEPQTTQHKVELITIDSTLKTADLTVALADKENSSGIKSPNGKKKKKERSELKMKILGKDKSHKKDIKAKVSPKRMKTLGASIEIPDQPEHEKSDVIQTFEPHTKLQGDLRALDANTETINSESSRVISANSEQDDKQKQETKTGLTFKLPKIGLSDITTEETIQTVEECTTKIEHLTNKSIEWKEDPYEQLSKRSLSRVLPKREEIEIPGMEDISMRSTAKGKQPKAGFVGHYEELQAETVQLSIDVDSVKEAVSKLPGYKLPKVDMSGLPIPEEITVIDANAQRISVKTPTKVVGTKAKDETQVTKCDITAPPEISKTTVRLPKITPSDLNSGALLIDTKADLKKSGKKYRSKAKQSEKETEVYKREDIIIPGKESPQEVSLLRAKGTETIRSEYESTATISPKGSDKKSRKAKIKTDSFEIARPEIKIPDIGIDFPKQNITKQKNAGEAIPEVKTSKTEERNVEGQIEGVISDVKIPEIDTIEYIDSGGASPDWKDCGILHTGFGVNLHAAKPNTDFSTTVSSGEVNDAEEHTIKLPEFGPATTDINVNVAGADMDEHINGAEIKTSERKIKGSKFKMPTLNISMPKVKGPKIDLSKKDTDVTLPYVKAEGKLPEDPEIDVKLGSIDVSIPQQKVNDGLEVKPLQTDGELDGRGRRFKMPKLGIAKPKVKGPEADQSFSKKDRYLPEPKFNIKISEDANIYVNAETPQSDSEVDRQGSKIKMPSLEISLPKIQKDTDVTLAEAKDAEGSPSKLKISAFIQPTFEGDEVSNKTKVTQIPSHLKSSEEGVAVVMKAPKTDIEGPSLDLKTTEVELDVKDSKFKMPKFGISLPKLIGPEIDLNSSKKDVDVTLDEDTAEDKLAFVEHTEPGIKAEVKVPEMTVHQQDAEGSPSKFKMPTFKLPKFGVGTPNVSGKVTYLEKDVKIDAAVLSVDFEGPSEDIKNTGKEHDQKGNKFKMPNFGLFMPKEKGPKIDPSLTGKDVDVTLPEAKADVALPEVDLGQVDISISETKTKVKLREPPEIALEKKPSECETDRDDHGRKFKRTKFGIIMPEMKGPEFDLSLSKRDTDNTLSGTKAEVKLLEVHQIDASPRKAEIVTPKVMVEFKKTEAEIKPQQTDGELEGQGEKFKLQQIGITMPRVKGPEVDLTISKKDIDVTLPETKAEVTLSDIYKTEIDMKSAECEAEIDGQKGKFKMAKFGMSMPKVKGQEIDFGSSNNHADVTLPKAKAEVNLLDVEPNETSANVEIKTAEIETPLYNVKESTSKFKLPAFKLPKFGVKIDGGDIKNPEEVLTVDAEAPNIETEVPSIQIKTTEPKHEGKGKKFKMPSLGFSAPQVDRPEIDLSLSKKDVDVTLPEVKAEVKLPHVKPKEPSAQTEMRPPDITVETKTKEGSPSKLKMPTFKLPKFGVGTPRATINVPDVDKDVKIDGSDIKIPEEVLTLDVEAPSIENEAPSIQTKTTGTELEGKRKKFKMPSLGFSVPQVETPEIDLNLSKKDVDVTLPEVKAEVRLPDVKLKEPSAQIEIRPPDITVETKTKEGSPSKFKIPAFKLPKFGVGTPRATINVPDVDKDVKIDRSDIKIPEEVLTLDVEAPSIETETPSIQIKTTGTELEGKGKKFKMPSLGFSAPQVDRPEIDLNLSKKDVDVTLPEVKAEVKLPDVKLKEPSAQIEIRPPDITVETQTKEGSPSKFKIPTFKLPKFGVGTPSATTNLPDVDKDVKIVGSDIKIPEEVLTVDAEAPNIETEVPSIHIKTTDPEHEGKGKKFKMPSLGFSGPQVETPEIDLSLSKKDVDVTLPEVKVEVKLPDVKLKEPSAEIEMRPPDITVGTKTKEGSPSKFKIPTFKLPKFGVGTPSATINLPDVDKDVKIDGSDIKIPEEVLTLDVEAPNIETEAPSIQIKPTGTELEGKGKKFKMPSLGFSVPQVDRPEIDLNLSKKDVDVTLPEVKAEVRLPDVKLKEPSAQIEIRPPDITVETKTKEGSPSKFKIPTFKLPKFGVGTPSATINLPDVDKDVKIDGGDIKIPEEVLTLDVEAPSIETEAPSIQIKTKGIELEGKGKKFKMPSLGFSGPQVETPEIDLNLLKKDVDVTLPEVKAEVKLPDVKLKEPSAEIEMRPPDITVETKTKEGSPSKFKIPTFKLPKFGVGTPSATINLPNVDKDVKIDGSDIKIPEEVLTLDVEAPSIETEAPSIQIKTTGTELEGKGKKFKMPSLGFSAPQVDRPEIDLSLSKKDVDVTLPEVKAEVKLPDVKLKEPSAQTEMRPPDITVETKTKEGSPSKLKMPTFKLPKFGVGTPRATINVPDVDKDVKIDGSDIKIPEEVLTLDVEAPSIETEAPSIQIKTTGTELEGKRKKFKMPSLGFSVPQVETPEIDLNLSKKDVDVTLPEVKAEVRLPDVKLKEPSAQIEIRPPDITVETQTKEGSSSKFKIPTFKLPKFGVGTPSATTNLPNVDKDVKIDGSDIKIPEEVLTLDAEAPNIETEVPSIHIKTTEPEHERKGKKFKMPSLGFSGPQVETPEIDFNLSKKDVDVTLPEVYAEVKLPDVKLKEPSAEIEMRPPDITVGTKTKEGSPSKFNIPTFKLPKFGVGTPSATINLPDVDKDVKIDGGDIKIPEEVLTVDVEAPNIETEVPSIHIKTTEPEHEGKGKKFKMPSLGFSAPQVDRPEIDLNLSKKDVDVTLPEVKAEVKLPDVKLKEPSAQIEIRSPDITVGTKTKEGSPSKFKIPAFKLPKFGVGTPSATINVPDVDKDVKIDGSDIKIPEEVLTLDVEAPSIETEAPSIQIKTTGTELEGKGKKFKMPSLGFSGPQVETPEIDLNLSKKDVDVTLPEVKAEVKLPDVKLKEPSAEIEMRPPEITVETKTKEGSPSKLKMPTFKLPKFGVGTPRATINLPDVDKDVKIDGGDIKIPEEVLTVDVEAPNIETEVPSIHIKTTEPEHEGKGKKFKMPSLGFSAPQVDRPEIDLNLSKKDVDVTLPEVKAEVKLPHVKLKEPSAQIEMRPPDITVGTKTKEGSPSKFKIPAFKLPKFGVGTPRATINVPDVDKDVKIDGSDIKIPEEVLTLDVEAPSIETEAPSIQIKTAGTELEGKGKKFKMPSLGFSGPQVDRPEIDLNLSKKDVDVTLPEVKAEVKLPDVKLKEPSAEIEMRPPDITVGTKTKEGSPSKFKIPAFKLPKFGVGTPRATINVPDVDKDVKIDGSDIKIPEEVLTLDVEAPSIETEAPSIQIKTTGTELEGKGKKFKMPSLGFSVPQVETPEIDFNLSKKNVDVTLPEVKAEVKLPDVKLKEPSSGIEMRPPDITVGTKTKEGSPSKFKIPAFKLPKFGVGTPSATINLPDVDKDVKIDGSDIKIPEEVLTLDVEAPSIETEAPSIQIKTTGIELEGKGKKFKMSSLGFSVPQVETPEIDLSLSKKDVDLTLPEVYAEVKLPDVKLKEPLAEIEMRPPEITVETKTKEGSPSKLKMPTFKLPKFGAGTPRATINVPDVDKDVKIDGSDIKIEGSELEGSGIKLKMPKFGISMPKVKVPEIDLSVSKKDVDATLPEAKTEVKLPSVQVQKPEAISVPDVPKVEVEATLKRPSWTFPKFSFSRTGVEAPDVDVQISTPKPDVTSPEAMAEACPPDVEAQESLDAVSKEPSAIVLDANLKKSKFSLPGFSFSKSVKEPEVSAELPHLNVSLQEGEEKVKQSEMKIKAPELDFEHDEHSSMFKLPQFNIALPKAKPPEEDLNASQKDVGITLPNIKAAVKLPEIEVKGTYDVTVDDITGSLPDEYKALIDTETPKTKSDSVELSSPTKFKLPSFKMPKLSFSRSKPEDEYVPVETECKEDQLEMEVEPKGESKSTKMSLTSLGELLKNIDVEFDVSNPEKGGENLHETDECCEKQSEPKEKETNSEQDTTKSPERTGWFKFPKFGPSSPSDPAKKEYKDKNSPVGKTDEEISPTCSVQSSDVFADISSAMTSEHVGLSSSSPTKVTVKYSDPNTVTALEEMRSNIITSTTRSELISVEPNLPEKVILSSGASSSSDDTLRLESSKVHVITSNIQATPEAQHAKLLTAVHVQPAGGLSFKSEGNDAASWTVEDSQSGTRTTYERHLVRETSSERSESKETIVITKQITQTSMFESSEPISGETASSIQRLRQSVHSEKMRFFDGAEK